MRKERILIVDDSEMHRSVLADMIGESYDILEAEDGVQAVATLRQMHETVDLLLLDIDMPRMDGFGVLQAMQENQWIDEIPVIIMPAGTGSSQIERAYALGATDSIMPPFDAFIVRRRVANTLLLFAKKKQMMAMVERQLDYERMKNNFFSAAAEEIQFEYTASSHTLTLSPRGAKKLGVGERILDAYSDSRVQELLGGIRWGECDKLLSRTTPEQPEIHFECKIDCDGVPRWHRVVIRSVWTDDDPPRCEGALGKAIDIHETRMELEQLKKRASRDALTGLLNIENAKSRIESRLANTPAGNYIMAYFDLDDFKRINDTYGHQFGNQVLQHVAEVLNLGLRSDDISSRFGGDEFLLFLECSEAHEQEVIRRIFSRLCAPYLEYPLSVSMGVARTADVGADFARLFRAADQALYFAKKNGRGHYRFYDASMQNMLLSPQERAAAKQTDADGTPPENGQ